MDPSEARIGLKVVSSVTGAGGFITRIEAEGDIFVRWKGAPRAVLVNPQQLEPPDEEE